MSRNMTASEHMLQALVAVVVLMVAGVLCEEQYERACRYWCIKNGKLFCCGVNKVVKLPSRGKLLLFSSSKI